MDSAPSTAPARKDSVEVSVPDNVATTTSSSEVEASKQPGASWQLNGTNIAAIQEGLMHNYTEAAEEFNYPHQVDDRHKTTVARVGRVGWIAKGIVYSILGGLTCKVAAVGHAGKGLDASPQGAFVLVASNAVGYPLIAVMGLGVLLYAIWRFWEGFTGQGYDATYSNAMNFFKFRLSPVISGFVYMSYLVFLLSLIPDVDKEPEEKNDDQQFPASWTGSVIGKIGVAVIGVAFLIATGIQLQGAFTKAFHHDYRKDIPRSQRLGVIVIGHLGFLGRAGAFLAVAAFFFRSLQHTVGGSGYTVGESLYQLQGSGWGRTVLFFIGIFLVVYGLFAVLSAYARIFPTPPPSGIRQEHRHHHVAAPGKEAGLLSKGLSFISRSGRKGTVQ